MSALASTALRDLNPWVGEAAAHRALALALAPPLRDLVTAVATDPRNAWWSAPLDRAAHLLLTGRNDPLHDPMHLPVPTGPIDSWEAYAQKPLQSIATSTELPGPPEEAIRSGAHAQLACGVSDGDPGYPVRQECVEVAPSARVYEVGSAADWHSLVRLYRDPATHPGSDASLRAARGLDNGLAPT